MNISEEQIIKNILEIRNKQRLTQEYVSIELGVSLATYSRIEKGGITLSYSKLADIARIFKLSVIDVITYPRIFVDKDSANIPERISITFEVSPDKRDYLLKMVTGEK